MGGIQELEDMQKPKIVIIGAGLEALHVVARLSADALKVSCVPLSYYLGFLHDLRALTHFLLL